MTISEMRDKLKEIPVDEVAALDAVIEVMGSSATFEQLVDLALARAKVEWSEDETAVQPVEIAIALLTGAVNVIKAAQARAAGV